MAQKRYYQLLTVVDGVTKYDFVACHSPKDFLGDYIIAEGEKPRAGRTYIKRGAQYAQNAPTIQYTPINKDYYESCLQTLNAASGLEPEPETPASEFTDGFTYSREEMEAEPNGDDSIWASSNAPRKGSVRYCAWNGQLPYEATDIESDTAWYFAHKSQAYDQLREIGIKSADIEYFATDDRDNEITPDGDFMIWFEYQDGKRKYAVITAPNYFDALQKARERAKAESIATLTPDNKIDRDYRCARITAPATIAPYKAAPPLSKRQQRRASSEIFGVQKFNSGGFTI